MISWKVDEAASTNFFFHHIQHFFTLLHNCINTVILAEQSLHHNIILEKLDHCCASRICTKKVISESHTLKFVSYITRNTSMLFAYSFFPFSYFFLSLSYIIWNRVKGFAYSLFSFSYFFFFSFLSYIIWKRVKGFAYSKSLFSYFFFSLSYIIWKRVKAFAYSKSSFSYFFFHFHIQYENESKDLLILILHSAISFAWLFLSYVVWKWVKGFASFFSLFSYFFFSLSYTIWKRVKAFAYSKSSFSYFFFHFHIQYENESKHLLIQNRYSAISFFFFWLHSLLFV